MADVFEKLRKMRLKMHELDRVKCTSAPGLAWQGTLKKAEVKLELSIHIDMILVVAKVIRGGICDAIHRYTKANN